MPVTLTDDNTVFPAVTAPTNSDAITTVDIRAGLQSLANRTANTIAKRGAVNGLAPLNSTAQVPNANLPFGLSGGIAQADGTGRTPAASVRNGIISVASASFTSGPASTYGTTTSTSYVDITSALLAVTGASVGDLLKIDLSFRLVAGAAGAFTRLIVVDPSITNALQEFGHGNAVDTVVTFAWVFTVTTAGTQTIKPQYKANGSGTQSAYSISISGTLIRP